jgi:hypothetical protein
MSASAFSATIACRSVPPSCQRPAPTKVRLIACLLAMTVVAALSPGGAAAAFRADVSLQRSSGASATAFKIERDVSLSFDHQLGAAEAQRRVAARLERLRAEFADRVGSSRVTWTGNNAVVEVSAFGQSAVGRVYVTETNVRIQAHLPLLLAPLGGKIESFLTKLSVETLQGGPPAKPHKPTHRR